MGQWNGRLRVGTSRPAREAASLRTFMGTVMKNRILAACVIAAAACVAQASPTQMYYNSFENPASATAGFTGVVNLSWTSTFSNFLGRYSQTDLTSLTLTAPADTVVPHEGQHLMYTVTWDLYIIDSWDGLGTQYGQDRWIMRANGADVFNEAFDNYGINQTFRNPDVGPINLGYGNAMPDSIYRNLSVTFEGQFGRPLTLDFTSTRLQGVWDESWGLDNLRIGYEVVPTPGVGSLAGLAGVAALRRRRR